MRKGLWFAAVAIIFVSGVSPASAEIITFNFTGRMTILAPDGTVFANSDAQGLIDPYGYQTPISAALSFDTNSGVGSSNLQVSVVNFLGSPGFFHDISFLREGMTNLLDGTTLVDWNSNTNMISYIQWDATGMINAINFGLQVGDKISGKSLYRDFNHDGLYDASELVVSDLGSAIPYTDSGLQPFGSSQPWYPNQGPAPMAATAGTTGMPSGPFPGTRIFLDIGSGNSMYVTSVQTVPLPAAAWLFGSGLLGLGGWARKRA